VFVDLQSALEINLLQFLQQIGFLAVSNFRGQRHKKITNGFVSALSYFLTMYAKNFSSVLKF